VLLISKHIMMQLRVQTRHTVRGANTHILGYTSNHKCAFIGALPLDERARSLIRAR
jgi:hypothetical protein